MSRDAGTAERIYDKLKAALLNGTLSRHARMDFAELATLYGVSTTPVREAAMRLLGEGLIELHPKVGARPVRLSEYRLRALLDAHAKLIHLALNAAIEPVELGAGWADATSDDRRVRLIFVAIARATGIPS